jgi:hypothetical protein
VSDGSADRNEDGDIEPVFTGKTSSIEELLLLGNVGTKESD